VPLWVYETRLELDEVLNLEDLRLSENSMPMPQSSMLGVRADPTVIAG
jgi:hypothetical protein